MASDHPYSLDPVRRGGCPPLRRGGKPIGALGGLQANQGLRIFKKGKTSAIKALSQGVTIGRPQSAGLVHEDLTYQFESNVKIVSVLHKQRFQGHGWSHGAQIGLAVMGEEDVLKAKKLFWIDRNVASSFAKKISAQDQMADQSARGRFRIGLVRGVQFEELADIVEHGPGDNQGRIKQWPVFLETFRICLGQHCGVFGHA